ncbi:WD40 repeat-like protein, partial [Dendrothele bispora CBS 962.96]
MTADLTARAQELDNLKDQGNSSEVKHHFEKLARKLESINNQLKKKLGHSTLHRALQAGHDAQEIKSYYQELQAAYDQCKTGVLFKIERDTTRILKTVIMSKLKNSEQAPHDVGPNKIPCLDGTRVTILKDIMKWAQDPSLNASSGYWMCGAAGTGKSTIAKSLCLMLEEKQLLAGSFFCSRQIQECREYHHIIPTIAYQLAYYSHTFRETLERILEQHQNVALKEPSIQVKELLIQPWEVVMKTKRFEGCSPVIVIDALDECENISEVLKAMVPAIQNRQMAGLKFFFTSRPSNNVSSCLEIGSKDSNSEKMHMENFYLHNVEKSQVQDDIKKFLQCQLQNIQITKEQIQTLVNSSGKLFIYAATTAKYITNVGGYEKQRLHNVLSLTQGPHAMHVEGIDILYNQILEEDIPMKKQSTIERDTSLKIVHTVVSVASPVTCKTIACLLGYDIEVVEATISSLQSVVYINKRDGKIHIFHASFSDYIFSAERSKMNHCDQSMHQVLIEKACIDMMSQKLHFNICNLPSSFVPDKKVPDIEKKVEKCITGELRYCCFSWAYHLGKCMVDEEMIELLRTFIQKKMIFWVEAMFLLDELPLCLEIIEAALKVESGEENKGMLRQIKEMVNICTLGKIQGRTPHLYLSIVPLFLKESPVLDKFHNLMDVQKAEEGIRQLGSWEILSPVKSISFSSDGERIVSGSDDNTVRVWNARTGAPEGDPFQGHSDWVTSVAFSPDGERIVSGSGDNTVRVWNARTGAPEGDPFQGHSHSISSVAFSPDGERIVSGSYDKTVKIWNAKTGAPVGDPIQGHSHWVTSVAYSPDGERIVSGSSDKTVRVWNAKTGAPEGDPFQGHSDWVTSVAFSPDGERIVSGSDDNTVRVWNARTGAPERDPLQGHIGSVSAVAFSPDGELIVSGSGDNTVRTWNARTGAPKGDPFQGHTHWVTSVACSLDGERIVSGSDDKTVRVWNARTGTPEGDSFQGHDHWITSVAFSLDGERIASGSFDKTVRVWDAKTGAPKGNPFQGHSRWVSSVAFSPDGERVVSGSYDKTLRVWTAKTGAPEGDPFWGHSRLVTSVAFSSDGERIVSGSDDKTIRVWNARTGAPEGDPFQGHTEWITLAVAFSPNRERIVSGSGDRTVRVWNVRTGAQEGDPLQGHSDCISSVVFSPDGKRIVSGSYDKTVRVWNVKAHAPEGDPIQGHSHWITSVAFSPDGERIVSGSADMTVRVWNAMTGAPERDPFQGHSHWVTSVAFSPMGNRIVSGSTDKTVRVWNAKTGAPEGDPFQGHDDWGTSVESSPDGKSI